MPSHPSEPHLILIVERDKRMRELQRFFLDRAGYAIAFADDGQAGIDQARATAPALVVTEILVPKVDGLTLCRRLRDDPATSALPVVVFSILAAEARAREAGARAFLRKPLVEQVFLATIRDLIAAQPSGTTEQQWVTR